MVVNAVTIYAFNKKERKKTLTRGHVEDIGSTAGIQSYMSRVTGRVPTSSRTAMSM
jgi:hypothetical protein